MNKVKKSIRILRINTMVLLMGVLILELIFGGWFNKQNNLDSLFVVRDRVVKVDLNGLYSYHKSTISVTKDRYGFRGGASTYNNPAAIDILCVGGSTTQQIYVEDGHTWPDVLENELKASGVELNVANAGIDGQSTFGHIKNFELWFPEISELKPQYVFFYVGVNDFFRPSSRLGSDDIKRNNFVSRLRGKLKDNSALYRGYRTVLGMIEADRQELTHSRIKFEEIQYSKGDSWSSADFDAFFDDRLEAYYERLKLLVKHSQTLGAIPVFITQPSRRFKFDEANEVIGHTKKFEVKNSGYQLDGTDYYYLLKEMNKVIEKVANEGDWLVINQTDLRTFSDDDYYDFTHTTPSGSLKIGGHMAQRFLEYLGEVQANEEID